MISFEEIESLVKRNFKGRFTSVRRINKVTTRIEFIDKSFLDIFQSIKDSSKYAFHLRFSNGRIFRLDCRPERKYRKFKTSPWHFHKETEANVVNSPFSPQNRIALIQFFKLVKEELIFSKN